MLEILIPSQEFFNEETSEFVRPKCLGKDGKKLRLEHSLVSISKWESNWKKRFLTKEDKTSEEVRDYVRCMTLTQNVDPEVYLYLTAENIKEINDYIQDPMSGTTFPKEKPKTGYREETSSELIYYWMVALEIPVEFQRWHFNRLLNLIRICNIKNAPQKKSSMNDIISQQKKIEAANRAKLHLHG